MKRTRASILVALTVVVLGLRTGTANSDGDHHWEVDTDPTGVNVEIGTRDGFPALGGRTGGPAVHCTMRLVPIEGSFPGMGGQLFPLVGGDPNRPLIPYYLSCPGLPERLVFVDVNRPGGIRIRGPREIADDVTRHIPVPSASIGINPARGLTGLASWFWVAGPPPPPVSQVVNELGMSVTVNAVPSSYEWDFGDGARVATHSIGRPFPQKSDIQHVYERIALAPKPYTVTLTFVYEVTFSVDGGPPVAAPPIRRSASRTLEVTESRGVLTPAETPQ